ncbi:ISAs1 family transposase [Polaromonas sp. P2-4]|nr:ISAs1 family transposase [Polaromonas sp. P2-4]
MLRRNGFGTPAVGKIQQCLCLMAHPPVLPLSTTFTNPARSSCVNSSTLSFISINIRFFEGCHHITEQLSSKRLSMAISDTYSESDAGHGRVESRRCVVSSQIDWLEQRPQWCGLTNIAMIEETRDINGKISCDRRVFISSLPANARQIATAVRAHWAIENTLHWTLDVVFNEDQSRVRKDHAPQNMAIVRHVVLNMLDTAKKQFKGIGVKALRKKAGWGNENLRLILMKNF